MSQHRILLADADESLLTAYREYLTAVGFCVSTARTGLQCVESLTEFTPEVVVLDPAVMTGWSDGMISIMIDGADEPWLRVIVLTTHENDDDTHARFAPFPVSAWHMKSLGPAALVHRIQLVLRTAADRDVFVTEWEQTPVAAGHSA